jgi:hypothetical protein
MKTFANVWNTLFVVGAFTACILSCKKTDAPPENNNNNGNNSSGANADTVSNHLQFMVGQEIHGTSPKGPSGSSMKISFQDTLYLMDDVQIPIKFLQMDTTKKVSGVFIQVVGLQGGPIASNYYDVPNVAQIDSTSDTVSIIMVGIDPKGLDLPFDFNITITPHSSNGDPIVQITRPVKVTKHHKGPTTGQGACSLVLSPGKEWQWFSTSIKSRTRDGWDFFDDPNRVFGAGGQVINGSCCAGTSVYGFCPGKHATNASLHFATYYQISDEIFTFTDQNNYSRITIEENPAPLPASSNFCAGPEGLVEPNIQTTSYTGTFAIVPATIPADLEHYGDSLEIQLTQTNTNGSGGGFGNGMGVIHNLDCEAGLLELIQVDLEGFGQHIYRLYKAVSQGSQKWFSM